MLRPENEKSEGDSLIVKQGSGDGSRDRLRERERSRDNTIDKSIKSED